MTKSRQNLIPTTDELHDVHGTITQCYKSNCGLKICFSDEIECLVNKLIVTFELFYRKQPEGNSCNFVQKFEIASVSNSENRVVDLEFPE